MRNLISALCAMLLIGCGTTTVIETSWDVGTLSELESRCNQDCQATVVLADSTVRPISARQLAIQEGTLSWWPATGPFAGTAPLNSVSEVAIARRNHGRGALQGLGTGILFAGAVGGFMGAASWEPCESTEFLGCFLHPETRGEAFIWGAMAGAIVGGATGLLVGALGGAEEVTVYRYRPGTARQVDVVVGISPSGGRAASTYLTR